MFEIAKGASAADWERTSLIAALIWNVNVNKKSKTKKPEDFNPYA